METIGKIPNVESRKSMTDLPFGTIWCLGVPPHERPFVEAAFEGAQCHFPSVREAGGTHNVGVSDLLMTRVRNSERPVVLRWPGVEMERFSEPLRGAGIAFGMLRSSILGAPFDATQPVRAYGFRMDPDPDVPDMLPDFPAAEVGAVVALWREQFLLDCNPRRLGNRQTVLVVADDPASRNTGNDPERFMAYAELLSNARNAHPLEQIVFLTNGETDLPAALQEAIACDADRICELEWSPALLAHVGTVYARESRALLDACLVGLKSCSLSGPETEVSLATRHLLKGAAYFDPVRGAHMSPRDAIALCAARMRLTSSGDPDDATLAARLLDDIPARKHVVEILDPPRPVTRLTGGARLVPPDWLLQDTASPGWAEARAIGLQEDMALAGTILGWQDLYSLPLIRARGEEAALQVSRMAELQPELLCEILEERLVRAAPDCVILCDLADPSVRALSRAAMRCGLLRVALPPETLISDARFYDRASSLADLVFTWHAAHGPLLKAAGLEPGRIRPVLVPARETGHGGRIIVLVDIARPWNIDLETVRVLDNIADALSIEVRLALHVDAMRALSQDVMTEIDMCSNLALVKGGTRSHTLLRHLRGVVGVISQTPSTAMKAGMLGLTSHMDTDFTDRPEGLGQILLDMTDRLNEADAATPLEDAVPGPEALTALLSGATGRPTPPTSAMHTLLAGGRTPLHEVISTSVLPETSTQIHIWEMLDIRRFFRPQALSTASQLADTDVLLEWGNKFRASRNRTYHNAARMGLDRLVLEDGFIRSVEIGLSGVPSLSVVLDDMTAFYDATRPSRIETILNEDAELSEAQRDRARRVIDRIGETKVSKYNFAPYRKVSVGREGYPKILLVDQRAGDFSIVSGMASEKSFREMVAAALEFADTHDIIIKTHPDRNVGGKESAIGETTFALLANNPAVTVVTEDLNPYSLIDIAEKVFVVTSGMGFEALLTGREVWCFGMPFYAGWGLTKDTLRLSRRKVRRSLEEVFHAFYIRLSRYYDPVAGRPCEIETLIDHIVATRPWSLSDAERETLQAPNLHHAAVPGLSGRVWITGPAPWTDWIRRVLRIDGDLHAITSNEFVTSVPELHATEDATVIVPENARIPGLPTAARNGSFRLYHVAESLPGSRANLPDQEMPWSFRLGEGLPEESEAAFVRKLVQQREHAFDLVEEARACREALTGYGLSASPAGRRRAQPGATVLVGMADEKRDQALLQHALSEDMQEGPLVYLPPQGIEIREIRRRLIPLGQEGRRIRIDPQAGLQGAAQVLVDSGPEGFDALLAGTPVTTLGHPFYAGWGLTEDIAAAAQPQCMTLDELVAAALMIETIHARPDTGDRLSLADMIETMRSLF